MRTVVALARCSHFAPTVAVTAFAALMALSAGRAGGAAWVGLAVLAGQLSVGWSNDWLDRDRDRVAGRVDKPLVRGDISDGLLLRCAVGALVLAIPLSFASGFAAGGVHLFAVAFAWAYNLRLKSTVISFVPYLAAFGLLPAFVTLGLTPAVWPPWWAVLAGAALGAGAHFTNAVPDLADDAATGVRGLPHVLGRVGSLVVAGGLLGAGALAVTLGPEGPPNGLQLLALGLSLAGVVAIVVLGSTGRPRLAFPATLGVAGVVVVAFLTAGAQLT